MNSAHTARLEWQDFQELAPDANAALLTLSQAAAHHGFDKKTLELVSCGFRSSTPARSASPGM